MENAEAGEFITKRKFFTPLKNFIDNFKKPHTNRMQNELVQEKEFTKLRPSNTLFFHGTSMEKIPGILKNGLITTGETDNLSRNLMYSLHFEEEYNSEFSFRNTADNFALTVWRNSKEIGRREHLRYQNFGPNGKIKVEVDLPEDYRQRDDFRRSQKLEEYRKLNSDNCIAVIPITKENEQFFIKEQLKFLYNLATPEEIEAEIKEFLTESENKIEMRGGYGIDTFAHDLIGEIQNAVLKNYTGYAAKNIAKDIPEWDQRDWERSFNTDKLVRAIADVEIKRRVVNEPVSKRYLDLLSLKYKKLLNSLNKTNLHPTNLDPRVRPTSFGDAHLYDLWGNNLGIKRAQEIGKEMGINIWE